MRFARAAARPIRALLVLAFSTLAAAQSAPTARLKVGKTISADLTEGQTHSYSIKLKANQYLRAVVTQASPALMVELYAPDRKKALEVDTRNFPYKPSWIVWVSETAGEYRISVNVPGEATDSKRYEIKLEELRKALPDDGKRVEAERLFTQGLGEARRNANDQAIATYTRAQDLYREFKDREREADTLTAAGSAYDIIGESEKAISYHERALAIRLELKDRFGEGMSLNNLGFVSGHVSQNEKAIRYHDQALAIFREVGSRAGEGNALMNLGNEYGDLSQNEKAIGYYEQALAIYREVHDRLKEGYALGDLGVSYKQLSRYEKAIGYYEQMLSIVRELKDRRSEGLLEANIGNAYYYLGLYEKAIGYFDQGLTIARELRDRRGEGISLIGLGNASTALGQYEKGISYFEPALEIEHGIEDRRAESMALGNLGDDYLYLRQYQKAIDYYTRAMSIAREIGARDAEALGLSHLGFAYARLGQPETAVGYYEEALAIQREIKDRQGEGATLASLGDPYSSLHQYEKAIGYYEKALTISREVKDRTTEAEELSGLMDIWQSSGSPRLAIFYGKQAVNTVQSIRADIAGLSQDLQQSYLKGNEKPYHTLAEILIAQGRLAEAEQVLALLKEEEYFQYIRRDADEASTLKRRADLTPEEAEYEKRYRQIGNQLMTIGVEHGELLSKKALTPEQSQHLLQLEQDLIAGNHAFEHFLGDLTQHFSAKPEMTVRVETLRETQGMMEDLRELPAGTVAIFTLIGDEKLYAILRTPDAQKAYEYPIKAADLNRKILEFRQVIQDPTLDPRPLAQELYKILIGGMADDLRQAKATDADVVARRRAALRSPGCAL
jgi:tetratricopeptide (TPR) repeat protein